MTQLRIRFQKLLNRTLILAMAILQAVILPTYLSHIAYAEEMASSPTTDSSQTTTGPATPTGADGTSYTYNETTGLWENDYYTWDPVTKQTKPKVAPSYSYNPETGMWDTTEWRYDAPSGKYVENTVSTPAEPVDQPTTPETKTSTPAPSQTQSLTGPSSSNGIEDTQSTNGAFDLYYNANISNNITLDATSGDVNLISNTLAGDGTSGSATSMANIINMLQSAWGPGAGSINTFNVDITGDVFGDFYIDPSQLYGTVDTSETTVNELDLEVENTAQMENDITVTAQSGDVNGMSNTSVGDLSSGTANAVANVVNMINSMISSGESFVGSINIHGNYEGDILLPEESIRALLASNDIPKTTINTAQIQNNETVVDITNDQSVTNNVTANAASGDVSLSGNTAAGSATSGDSNTNITVLNLTGQQVIGSNALLVFVNVLGEWVGMIVNAPAGSTAAALGSSDSSVTGSANIDVDNQFQIENNINLDAQSGNVSGEHNTEVGDATSGDATASANIANLTNSSFSMSNWFGLLFINVFGKWHGSFGINTEAGNLPVIPPALAGASGPTASAPAHVQVLRFVPSDQPVAHTSADQSDAVETINEALNEDRNTSGVLGASTDDSGSGGSKTAQGGINWSTIAPVGMLALLAIVGTEGIATLLNRRKSHA